MSVVTYNGVTLPYPFHTDFRQEAIYDDISGTDRILTQFDIKLQTLVNYNYLGLLAPDISAGITNPADIQNVIHSRLMQPRQKLSIKCNGVDLIPLPQTGNSGSVDAANGPQPQSCTITDITNVSFMISYHIVAKYWLNPQLGSSSPLVTNQPGSNVLYNRWTETMDIDHANYTTRTREGKFVIRSDNVDGLTADQIRIQMAVVGVPTGFLRSSSQWAQDPNGLGVRYKVVDREVFRLPPKPAFRAQGRYTEHASEFGAFHWAECYIKLEGDKLTDQAKLVEAAIVILCHKMKLRLAPAAASSPSVNFTVPMDATFTTDMYNNVVEASVKAFYKPSTTKDGKGRMQAFWGPDFKRLLDEPDPNGGDLNYEPQYLARGSAGRLLQAASYFDPDLRNWFINESEGNLNQGFQPGQAGQNQENSSISQTTGPLASNDNPLVGQELGTSQVTLTTVNTGPDTFAQFQDLTTPTSFFSDYMIVNKFESDKHIYMMPISSPVGFSNPSGNAQAGGTIQNNQTGQRAAFCQLASPTLLWICDWTAVKVDDIPEIPDSSITADPNWILMDEHYEPVSIHLTNDGVTAMYRISGTFVYGHPFPSTQVIQNIAFGRPPFVLDSFFRTIDKSKLTGGLIDQSSNLFLGGIGVGLVGAGGALGAGS